jgi:hypothetical protein
LRVEAKYHLDLATACFLQEELRASGFALDEHCRTSEGYTVSSIYLDDTSFTGYTDKVDGVSRRIKYRFRFYSEEIGDEPIRFEHKEKDGRLSWKRVSRVTPDDVRRFVTSWSGPVLNHLDPRAGYVAPVICVQYQRLAFVHRIHGIRINFDTHLRWRNIDATRQSLVSEASFEPLREDQVILEVKVPREYAREVADLVQRWNLHWQQTSKYAICIEHMQRCLLT